jgi:hypothetical protein
MKKKIKKDSRELVINKKAIDEDFKRFVRLEKAWIANVSHKIMKTKNGFTHYDRVGFRKSLLLHLQSKIKNFSYVDANNEMEGIFFCGDILDEKISQNDTKANSEVEK